jgi:hypothetical protein
LKTINEKFVKQMIKDKAEQKAKKKAQRIQAEADIRAVLTVRDKRISRR